MKIGQNSQTDRWYGFPRKDSACEQEGLSFSQKSGRPTISGEVAESKVNNSCQSHLFTLYLNYSIISHHNILQLIRSLMLKLARSDRKMLSTQSLLYAFLGKRSKYGLVRLLSRRPPCEKTPAPTKGAGTLYRSNGLFTRISSEGAQ